MGNIHSLNSALIESGCTNVKLSSDYKLIQTADKIILPGVGNFSKAMDLIKIRNLEESLYDFVVVKQKPILGICLGMQILGLSSTEDGKRDGLRFINGVVERFNSNGVKIPHVGYNQVQTNPQTVLLKSLPELSDFYFTHSYKMLSDEDINQSICHYSEDFIACYEKDNIAGTQFHPELSQKNGLTLLKNFIEKF
ncbi:MAG: imidazole glycerol phosphate synthase subunit HisH [Emcibacter sp.]|nr:imidazole glycerol phosphate synthase subunit HisH [Emcibacter sp.]